MLSYLYGIVVEGKEQEEEIAIRRPAGQAEKLKGK